MSINIIVSTFDAQNKTRIPHSLYSNDRRKEFLEKIANNHLPQPILLDMKEDLPKVHEPEEYGSHLRFDDEFWNELLKYNAGVLLSLPTLQKKGAEITRGLSWEQTVEDFAAELHLFPQLMAVSEFRHLLLPLASDDFASEGLIHIRNVKKKTGATSRLRGSLYFSPDKGLNKIQLSDKALLLLLNQDWDEPRPTAPFGND